MNRKKLFAAALAVLLLFSLSPTALAMGFEFPSMGLPTDLNGSFSLRDLLNGSNDSLTIAGSSISLDNVLFIEDCVVGEELDLCICEASANAFVLDADSLPKGCKTELRKEKRRLPDAKTGREVLEEEKIKANGGEVPAKPVPTDDQEVWYLYLTGKPNKAGEYLFIIWSDAIYLCSAEVQNSRSEAGQEALPQQKTDVFSGAEEGTGIWPGMSSGGNPPYFQPVVTDPPYFQSVVTDPPYIPPVVTDPPYFQSMVTDPPYFAPVVTDTPYIPPVVTDPPVVAPSVYVTGETQCRPGETVVLEAHASGGQSLRYQWYTSLGYFSAPIDGATGSIYMPDTSRAGTYSYFCRVTSSGYGGSAYTDSETILLNVIERKLAAVSLDSAPTKRSYTQGEALDTTGLRLLLRYDDGSVDYATGGFTASPTRLSSAGTVNVLVTYKGFNVGYTVNVRSVTESVRGIGVLTLPTKTSYKVGESLDSTGLSLRAYTNEGTYFDVNQGYNCQPSYFTGSGKQTVTVSYAGKTCTFSVNVEEDRRVTAIWIQSLPANRSYAVGDSISTAGLVIQARTNSGTETVTSGYTITPRVASTVGTQTVTVIYEGQSATYTIDVRQAEVPRPTSTPRPAATPTPTVEPTVTPMPYTGYVTPLPSGTPGPSSPAASAAPSAAPTPMPVRKNTGVNTLVKILFIVAVLALAALIGYVLYLRKSGYVEDESFDEPTPSEKLRAFFSRNKKDRDDR